MILSRGRAGEGACFQCVPREPSLRHTWADAQGGVLWPPCLSLDGRPQGGPPWQGHRGSPRSGQCPWARGHSGMAVALGPLKGQCSIASPPRQPHSLLPVSLCPQHQHEMGLCCEQHCPPRPPYRGDWPLEGRLPTFPPRLLCPQSVHPSSTSDRGGWSALRGKSPKDQVPRCFASLPRFLAGASHEQLQIKIEQEPAFGVH